MELRHLRYFLAVAEHRNFTRAAGVLGIGQPPLSSQIRDLENELGVRLFERLPHGAVLTPAGEAFAVEARQVLELAERAVRTAQRAGAGHTGRLAIGFTGSTVLNAVVPAAIARFRRAYPEVVLHLQEKPTADLLRSLLAGELDAAFVRPGRGHSKGIQLFRIEDEPLLAALPQAHPMSRSGQISLKSLANDDFVCFSRTAGADFYDDLMAACQRAGFAPRIVQEAPQITSLPALVAAGIGVCLVPASISQVRVPGVSYVALKQSPVATLSLATQASELSPAAANFVALVRKGM